MRVELIYAPGCASYKMTLNFLETVIAEERLPISVETVEADDYSHDFIASPTIRIDGQDIADLSVRLQGAVCRLYNSDEGISRIPSLEAFRSLLFRKWRELTAAPLLRT